MRTRRRQNPGDVTVPASVGYEVVDIEHFEVSVAVADGTNVEW